MKKNMSFDDRAFLHIAFDNGASQGWANVSVETVLSQMDKDTQAPPYLNTFDDIFKLFDDCIMNDVRTALDGSFDETMRIKDRLFDILMERFDAMADYKLGLRALMDEKAILAKLAVKSLCPFQRSMGDMMVLAGVDAFGPLAELKKAGLGVVYLKTVRVWLNDESDDLAATMAELDKNLSFAEQAANSFFAQKIFKANA